ncbi:hypothetical protein GCM10008961_00340 [Deinococcus knuensis]|uniref:Uncharacterized protein n=3 Tax=Deinococcus TaxID=1298 RepID=A0ABQ2SCQ3_9DEIO|nr:hypothetical protein GCM10008961_00340 [Deinococcus knuensis]
MPGRWGWDVCLECVLRGVAGVRPGCELFVSFVPSLSGFGLYTGGMKGLREFVDWLREVLKGSPQPQPVPIPVRVRDRR